MALSGELKDFGLAQLLTLVQVTGKTGSLTLERPGNTATIFFENGKLLRVKTLSSRSDGLTVALFRSGKIDRDQFQTIESAAPASEKAVALMLSDQGILSRDEIVDFVRERSLADLYWLMTWPDGTFRMEVEVTPPEEEITALTDLSPVIERARSYLNEWQLLNSYIPDLDRPIRLLAQPHAQTEEIKIGLPEWRMLATLAKEIPLREIARRLEMDEFQVRQVAYGLIDAGLADVPEAEALPPAPQGKAEPEVRSGGFNLFGRRK